jgi:hypothetical protein
MPGISYVVSDATDLPRDTPAVIVHVCNDIDGWRVEVEGPERA